MRREDTEVLYLVSDYNAPDRERRLRWSDPQFVITRPIEPGDRISLKSSKGLSSSGGFGAGESGKGIRRR